MTDKEVMQMALDALNNFDKGNHGMRWQVPVIKALRARLAQPEPEPVAYIDVETRNLSWAKLTRWETPTVVKMDKVPLYTAPPKKEWVGLTDDEIYEAVENSNSVLVKDMARSIEAMLKEKNAQAKED